MTDFPSADGDLPQRYKKVLDVLSLSDDDTKLKSSVAVETTLDSLYFEQQHVQTSTGENMMIRNQSSGINFFPVWQAIDENSNLDTTERVYSDLQTASYNEGANYIAFRELYPNPNASSVWRFTLKSGQVLEAGSYITYNVYYYNGSQTDTIGSSTFNDNLGNRIYRKLLKIENRIEVGETLEIAFDSPVEVHSGQLIYDEITIGADNGGEYFLAKESDTTNIFHRQVKYKTFTDVPIAKLSDVEAVAGSAVYKGAYDADADSPALPTGADANGDTYRVSVSGNGKEVGDLLIYNTTTSAYDHIPVKAVTQDGIAQSSLITYDWFVKPDYVGDVKTGTAYTPFVDIQSAINSASDGDSIFIDGSCVITGVITLPSDKSLYFYSTDTTEIKYATYASANDKIFYQSSSSCTKEFKFKNIKLLNSGDYAVYIRSASKVTFDDCELVNNGWSGSGLSTVLADDGSTLGYDSTQADLQAFWTGSETSNGGAMRIRSTAKVVVVDCDIHHNLRGLRIQDCGSGGYGYISRNQCYNNIESGIYLASGTYDASSGCENFTVYNNASKYNANNGVLVIGGINNVVSLNVIEGNWNAGVMGWHVSNTRLRDMDLTNNNRSQYNGIGNIGDARASIYIAGGTLNPVASFIADVLDTQVYNTGLGSNTSRVGLIIASDVSNINDVDRSLINVDDVGFKNQDYAVDVECDLDKVRLTLGDCRYIDTVEKNVRVATGNYFELPFSNHHTNIKDLDLSLDNTTSQIILKEGATGDVLNTYGVNTLQAVVFGTKIRILLKGSSKIQLEVEVANTSIDGSMVNSVLVNAVNQLNDLFTNASGFASGGNPVAAFALTGDDLTLTLQDGTSYTVDVTTLGVDENKFVSSGALNGSNLELTMNDASVITIDASNMINGSTLPAIADNWYIAYGGSAGNQVTTPGVTSANKGKQPFYNGDFLAKGEEYVWTHDSNGSYVLGIWNGLAQNYNDTAVFTDALWSTNFLFGATSGTVKETSVGVDVVSNYASGYAISNNTVLSLRYGNDNYLYLFDISAPEPILIGKSNTALIGDSQTIFMGGSNQPNAKIPVVIKRTNTWTIVADFDNSENNEWSDGIEAQTIIRSNAGLVKGYKFVWQLPAAGTNRYFAIGYTGAATGNATPVNDMVGAWRWQTNEIIQYADDWILNTSNSQYDDVTFGQPYWNPTDGNAVTVSYRYLQDGTLEMWDETRGELIMTYDTTLDGSVINLYYGANNYASSELMLPNLSVQQLGQGSQPVTSFAPDISNQSFDVAKNQAFNVQIALDADSDIVNQYGSLDSPSWAILNQATGYLNGTAPSSTGSHVVNCKAANAIGGITNFQVTLNVVEPTYTNTKSLKFADGVDSYLGGNASLITSLERSGNGAGDSDAWTIAFWAKGSSQNQGQTLFYFGASDVTNSGHIEIKQTNHNGAKRLRVRYGSTNNHLQLTTASGSINPDVWQHVMLTYDGGTTGVASGSLSSYYSRFKVFIDGALQTTSNVHSNNGYSGSLAGENFRFGRFTSGNYPRGAFLNQLAIWNSDQSSNIVGLYNGGDTQDISLLQADAGSMNSDYLPPAHYYEIEDSVSAILDLAGSANLVGYNFSSTDLVDDAP